MHRLVLSACAAISIALLSGCFNVRTAKPIAEKSDPELAKKLSGIWQSGGDSPVVLVEVDQGGVLQFATVKWSQQSGKFEMERAVGIVTQTPAGALLSVQGPEEKDWGLARLSMADDGRFGVGAEASQGWFDKAIAAGRLKGTVTKGKPTVVTSSREEIIEVLRKAIADHEAPFELEHHNALIRIAKPEWK